MRWVEAIKPDEDRMVTIDISQATLNNKSVTCHTSCQSLASLIMIPWLHSPRLIRALSSTIAVSISLNSAMADSTAVDISDAPLQRQALGQVFSIGSLYDARQDAFVPGKALSGLYAIP